MFGAKNKFKQFIAGWGLQGVMQIVKIYLIVLQINSIFKEAGKKGS